ncbi:MAG TPA: phage portal protein, partial [Moraxellaceae bacterium]|nr:phage portal protein [Moraxellaceae bacterium]
MGFFDTAKHWLGIKSLTPVNNGGGWTNIGTTMVNEPFMGAWQRNQELKTTDLLTYHAVFACLSLIAADVGKLRFYPKRMIDGVLTNAPSKANRILKKPNTIQTWQQFAENWVNSKNTRGNTYVWKQRDVF